MTAPTKYQNRIELLQGTLDMLVLQALLDEPMHGYAIAQIIRNRSGEVFTVETRISIPSTASSRTPEMRKVRMEADR
jgi:PadR family transcriptional regulator, regulatory protein PadR